jgi:single-stranded DNA-binding protein
MIEGWYNAAGERKERRNRVMVEVVGRDSAVIAKSVKLGSWVSIEGYIRSEQFKGQEFTKVRTLTVDAWESGDGREERTSTRGNDS